jgi:hypothetical protein
MFFHPTTRELHHHSQTSAQYLMFGNPFKHVGYHGYSVDPHTPGLFIVTHMFFSLNYLVYHGLMRVLICQFCNVYKVTMIHMKI